jgi:hypothetical protein
MDVGSQSYREYIVNWLVTEMDLGFDGMFGDNSLEIYPQTIWRLSAVPINPRTGQLYTDEDWLADRVGFINYLKSVAPDAVFLSNGMIYNGEEFFKDKALYEVFLRDAEIDGLFIEGVFNNDQGTPYSEAGWIKSVDLIIWLQDNFLNDPEKFIVCRSLTMRGLPDGVTEDSFTAFIFASTLMGTSRDGQNYVCAKGNMESAFTQSLFRIDLGTPTEEYHIIPDSHVYERDYTKTKILVNPTATAYTVDLGGSYINMNGEQVASIQVPKYSGLILIIP